MQLRLFGGAKLETDAEEPVRGRAAHRRRLAILALLATAPAKGVTRDRIIGYLWPDVDAEKGRRLLSEALYQLRKELGDEAIQAVGDILQLDATIVQSDVVAFRAAMQAGRLADAVALYTAPFLDAWYVDDAADFERWADQMREDLAREHRDALSQLAARAEEAGHWPDAALWLGRLARVDAYSPRVALRLAKALDASGERAAAIQALAAHENTLLRDLEIAVSDDVARLAAELKTAPPPTATPAIAERPQVATIDQPEAAFAAQPGARHAASSRRRRLTRTGLAALGALVVAVAVWRAQLISADAAPAVYDPHHIAVLYFDDHTAGKELSHIADGLTEELIHQLAQVPTLRVVSRNGVKRFRDAPVTPDSLAAALRAGTMVEGSVQRSGDSLRVTVQLIDGNSGLHLESQVFERPLMELFAIEQDLATSVAVTLRRHLGDAVQLRGLGSGTRNSTALDLVLRARSLRDDAERVAMHPHRHDMRSALVMLTRADSLLRLAERADPKWTRVLADRGWTQLQIARVSESDARTALAAGDSIATELVRRSPQLAEAYQLRGTARWRGVTGAMQISPDSPDARFAESDIRQALALDSTLATAWATLADILHVRGALAEAERAAESAVTHDAWLEGADETYFFGFGASLLLGKYAKAQQWCLQGQRAFPESWRFYECELTLLRDNIAARPDPLRAWQLVAKMDSLDPPKAAHATIHAYSPLYRRAVAAAVSARAGDAARARAEIQRLRASVAGDSVLALDLLYDEAYVWYWLGDTGRSDILLHTLFSARPMLREQYARLPLIAWLNAADRTPPAR